MFSLPIHKADTRIPLFNRWVCLIVSCLRRHSWCNMTARNAFVPAKHILHLRMPSITRDKSTMGVSSRRPATCACTSLNVLTQEAIIICKHCDVVHISVAFQFAGEVQCAVRMDLTVPSNFACFEFAWTKKIFWSDEIWKPVSALCQLPRRLDSTSSVSDSSTRAHPECWLGRGGVAV